MAVVAAFGAHPCYLCTRRACSVSIHRFLYTFWGVKSEGFIQALHSIDIRNLDDVFGVTVGFCERRHGGGCRTSQAAGTFGESFQHTLQLQCRRPPKISGARAFPL